MDKRYDIKEQIGQGGLGCVFRANDLRMKREVAIKRIRTFADDATISEEATRQLLQEAGALAALQHPNIVTIHDVGVDEESPYVVMELLNGDTLEDIITDASLTWPDFRELALQTMEALIAAQELHIVHRDLKPSNLMLVWLPSGKFQVKVLDFGLATLSEMPFLQNVDQNDGIFGSIYFMAPEQFERVLIDSKADIYAIGCLFYYALTGKYPFDGETEIEVMNSHLNHTVTPLQEMREGIPVWVCEWIMWHINRNPSDRPESARESLRTFLENDAVSDPILSTGLPAQKPAKTIRPRLIVPGAPIVPDIIDEVAEKQPTKTAAPSKPLAPPRGSKPSIHTSTHVPKPLTAVNPKTHSATVVPEINEQSTTSDSDLATPSSSTNQSNNQITDGDPTQSVTSNQVPSQYSSPQKKTALSNGTKITIAAVLGIFVIILSIIIVKTLGRNAETQVYNAMLMQAAGTDATEVSVDRKKLEILLRSAATVGANRDREGVFLALVLAKSTDGTDVDARIAEFSTKEVLLPNIRNIMIRDVLRNRKNPAVVDTLINYARSTNETLLVTAAIEATRFMVNDKHLPDFLNFITNSKDEAVRKEAEFNVAKIIEKSNNKTQLGGLIATAHDTTDDVTTRHILLRLLGAIGDSKSLKLTQDNLKSKNPEDQIAAIVALSKWPNNEGFTSLTNYIQSCADPKLRARAFEAAFLYLSNANVKSEVSWSLLAKEAKTQDEQIRLIRGITLVGPEKWVITMIENYTKDATESNGAVVDLAVKAIKYLQDLEKIQKNGSEGAK